jgi:hypothetical protein
MTCPLVVDGENSLQTWGLAVKTLNTQSQTDDKGLTAPRHKRPACYKMLHKALKLVGSCEHDNEPSGSIKGRKFLD